VPLLVSLRCSLLAAITRCLASNHQILFFETSFYTEVKASHPQVDVVIAYFVTTRLWFLHNSIINHRQFHQRAPTNFLARLWWWRLAVWFEENVRGPVPPVFELPLPSLRPAVEKVARASKTRLGRSRDI